MNLLCHSQKYFLSNPILSQIAWKRVGFPTSPQLSVKKEKADAQTAEPKLFSTFQVLAAGKLGIPAYIPVSSFWLTLYFPSGKKIILAITGLSRDVARNLFNKFYQNIL